MVVTINVTYAIHRFAGYIMANKIIVIYFLKKCKYYGKNVVKVDVSKYFHYIKCFTGF